jgi:hypothetical protein
MKDHSGGAEMEPVKGVVCAQPPARCGGFRERTLMAFAFISCVCGGEGLAKEQTLGADATPKPGVDSPAFFALPAVVDEPRAFSARAIPVDAPRAFSMTAAPIEEPQTFSATEFRRRRQGFSAADLGKHETSIIDAPMLDTSVARQWRESKSQDRVRLLTLWRSSVSSVSLQAGKHGMPSLQWSTPWMHRDVAARGLFDRLVTLSPRTGSGSRGVVPRQTGAFAAGKPADLSASLNTK